MTLHVYTASEVLTATNLNESVNPKAAIKTATETVNNSNTPQDDDQLFITPSTNVKYEVTCFFVYQSTSAVPDLVLGFTFPAGASFTWVPRGLTPTDGDQAPTQQAGYIRMASTSSTTNRSVGTQAANELVATPTGLLVMGATPGNLRLQWCQNVATAENTQLKANSFIVARRID